MSKIKRSQIEEWDLERVVPYGNNPKLHPDSHVKQIARSIGEFTFLDPIAVDENGEVLEGHGRLLAAKQRGDKTISVIQVSGLTEEQKVAYRDTHNKLTMNTGFDPELLKLDFEFLQSSGFDLEITGFSELEISNLLELSFLDDEPEGSNNGDSNSGEDNYEQPEEIISRVKLGEIWQLGRHKIACGDSTVESNVRALLGDNLAVLVHADPPYGMGKEKDGVMNDNLYGDKLDNFQMAWIKACRKNVEDNGSFYIWGNAEDLWRLWYSGGLKKSERLTFRNQIIWDKKHGQGMGSDDFRMYPTVTEHCLFFMLGEQGFNNNADNYWEGWDKILNYLKDQKRISKLTAKEIKTITEGRYNSQHWFEESQFELMQEKYYILLQNHCQQNNIDAFKKEYDELRKEYYATRAYFNNTHENMTDVWEYPRVQGEERWGHATPKPVDMISRIYKSSSPDDAVIYSPFLGSGTDVIAAQQIEGDRTVYGFELSPDYCEVIIQRFEKFTGIEAKLIGTLSTKLKDDTQSEEYLNSLGF
jgi:DNA modification methylase